MDAFFGVTDQCSGRCITCPAWTIKRPPQYMDLETFKVAWDKCNDSPLIERILINWIGDIYKHPDRAKFWDYMERNKNWDKQLVVTTTGDSIDYIIHAVNTLVISFNGYDKESYEGVMKIPFEKTVRNIRRWYKRLEQVPCAELHHIVFDKCNNVDKYFKLWEDFPGHIRYTTKYDTKKFTPDRTFEDARTEKIPCIYFDCLTIAPSGKVLMCVQDMRFLTDWGNIKTDEIADLFNRPERVEMKERHGKKDWSAFCEDCNCNVEIKNNVFFLKRRPY